MVQNIQMYVALPGRRLRSSQLLTTETVRGSLLQPEEMEINHRPHTKQPGLKRRIGQLRCNIQRFPQRFVRQPITCGDCEGVPQDSQKPGPVGADILKVVEPSASRFGCFLKAASPEKAVGQLIKGFTDQFPIAEIDVNLERVTKNCKYRIPLAKTSLGNRKAGQQVSSCSQVGGIQMRQGGP
jgi:hypothetical protein